MLGDDFMLTGRTAENLYKKFAKNAPIYDYHCHLSAKEIYEDKPFSDISSIWLSHDHYKWRAMRYAGIPEEYITGNQKSEEKFIMWAKTCEKLIGSPLYHWANMELREYFGVNEFLNTKNAGSIYKLCNIRLKEESLSPVKLIERSNVRLICTTDDPADSLQYHVLLKTVQKNSFKVLPAFRPDKALNILNEGFIEYIEALSIACKNSIGSYEDLMDSLRSRIKYFSEIGCLMSDHSLESIEFLSTSLAEVEAIFIRRLHGSMISSDEAEKYKCYTLKLLASEYYKAGWVMQLHIGAMRNTNLNMLKKLGVDAGFDIMNDFALAEALSRLLNDMEGAGGLPRTILYSLNSKDNLLLSSLPHCFAGDSAVAKLQFGAAWWFNDHKEGIYSHLKSIANQGMLAYFVGMLTDSRSYLSYVRHDYFRRILCSFIGELVDSGEFDNDERILQEIVEGICYKNIISYLGMK